MDKIATRDAYGEALASLGTARHDLVVLDADLSGSTKTSTFKKAFPERFFNLGIAEQNLMGVAAGMASCGKLAFASTFAVFACGRAYDQIRNTICYPALNVKIAATHAGLTVGEDGGSHQMLEDIALMRALPNMTVLVPADGIETKDAVLAAAEMDGPCYIRLGRPKVPVVTPANADFKIGKATVLRDGKDLCIIACGVMVAKALEAAERLQEEGIDTAVVNMASIKPIDRDTIVHYAEKTGAIVTAEEHNRFGGLFSAVSEVLAEEAPVPALAVAVNDTFGQSGTPDALLSHYGLTVESICMQGRKAYAKNKA